MKTELAVVTWMIWVGHVHDPVSNSTLSKTALGVYQTKAACEGSKDEWRRLLIAGYTAPLEALTCITAEEALNRLPANMGPRQGRPCIIRIAAKGGRVSDCAFAGKDSHRTIPKLPEYVSEMTVEHNSGVIPWSQ